MTTAAITHLSHVMLCPDNFRIKTLVGSYFEINTNIGVFLVIVSGKNEILYDQHVFCISK